MLKDRNRTSHTYNEEIADEISESILTRYFNEFVLSKNEFEKIIGAKK